ncbi:magnesium transporter [Thioalkalivibrio sp. XN279]|nr:magnesium transporter [Thioalkalivibrio sp. XN279]NHA15848.1 magnesium transporter [Thioalkalivibrio sp. XN279]
MVGALGAAIQAGDAVALRAVVDGEHPADIAGALEEFAAYQVWAVLDLLPLKAQADLFGYFGRDFQVEMAHQASRAKLARIVSEMNSDERADLFKGLSDEQQDALLPALAQAEREDIRRLAGYAEDTAGAIMSSDYAVLTASLSAAQAIEKLRHEAPNKETIYRAYVTAPDRRLLGAVRLRDLILASPKMLVRDLMEEGPLSVHVDEDQEEVARKISRYDVLALPVVDAEGRLVGIVTHDDAMDVIQEEATEDFHKVGSVGDLDSSVRDASIGLLYRKRIAWLVLLVFGNLVSGAGIHYYEDTIASVVALVFFLPLLIGSSGNAGSQAATLMVRALATGDVMLKDWGRMLGREVLIAVLLGLTMALAVSGIGWYRGGPGVALAVALTMVLVVMVGSLIGMSLPFILSRFKLDPATASAPLVTTLADASGVFIYFGVATAILFPG